MTRMNLAVAAAMAGMLAGPAVAQTAQTPPVAQTTPADMAQTPPAQPATPAAQVQPPVPDTGIKKAPTAHAHHRVHHRVHAKAPETTTPPAATQR